jgi:uncharacterized protein YukE
MENSNKDVYADLDMLLAWEKELQNINDSAIKVLDTLKGTIADLENYWIGNSAKGFTDASNKLLEHGKNCHTNMSEVSSFLVNVANTLEQQ